MLTLPIVQRIEELLAKRKSQRAVARAVGVSRRVVSRIARGQAAIRVRMRRRAAKAARLAAEIPFRPVATYVCEGCEAAVSFRPCPACHARAARQ